MTLSGKPYGDEASTFKDMEALRVLGQWARLEKMWAAQRLAGILLLSRNCVRWHVSPFGADKMPVAKPRLKFFSLGTVVLYHT